MNGKQLRGVPHRLNDGDVDLGRKRAFLFSERRRARHCRRPATASAAYLVDEQRPSARSAHQPLDADRARCVESPSSSDDPPRRAFTPRCGARQAGSPCTRWGRRARAERARARAAPRMLAEGDMLEIAFTKLRFTQSAPAGESADAGPRHTSRRRQRRDEAARPTLATSDAIRRPAGQRGARTFGASGSRSGWWSSRRSVRWPGVHGPLDASLRRQTRLILSAWLKPPTLARIDAGPRRTSRKRD